MKIVILFFVLVTGISTSTVQAQGSLPLLQGFMRDIANPNIDESTIIDKYLCFYLHQVPNRSENQDYVFAKGQITAVRIYMREENIAADQLKFYKYADIPAKDQKIFIQENDDVYASYFNNKLFNYFLIRDMRIDAFNTMNKGTKEIFISHCR